MPLSPGKKTDFRFRILYAAAIFMVCCSHTSGGGLSLLSDWFAYGDLHLALFCFTSGYFYDPSSEEHVCRYVLKKARALLLPLYLYNLAYGILVQLLRRKGFSIGGDFNLYNLLIAPVTNGHQFMFNLGSWFVVPLFMVQLYNVLLRRFLSYFVRFFSHFFSCSLPGKKKIPEAALFALSVALGLCGNQLACLGLRQGLWLVIVRFLHFVPYYGLGIFYRSDLEKYDRKIPSFPYLSAVFLLKLLIIYLCGRVPEYTPSWCYNFSEGPLMPLLTAFLGVALWLRLATVLEPVIGRSRWINLIADNTYSIMMNQFLGFMAVKTVFGLLSHVCSAFSDFDWVSYKSDIWWYYLPKGPENTLLIYVVGGIAFSILVQKLIDRVKKFYSKTTVSARY